MWLPIWIRFKGKRSKFLSHSTKNLQLLSAAAFIFLNKKALKKILITAAAFIIIKERVQNSFEDPFNQNFSIIVGRGIYFSIHYPL